MAQRVHHQLQDESVQCYCCSANSSKKIHRDLRKRQEAMTAPGIEKRYVHQVYDAIAPHFSDTRFAKWPKVAEFLGSLPRGSLLLDAGCGNGKYLGLNPDCVSVGCDMSAPLIGICSKLGFEVQVADTLSLPYVTECFDAALSIAVLHHLSTESRRRGALVELLRVLKVGGRLLVTVWAREQENASLIAKWTPLTGRFTERWVDSPTAKSSGGASAQEHENEREHDETNRVVRSSNEAKAAECTHSQASQTKPCAQEGAGVSMEHVIGEGWSRAELEEGIYANGRMDAVGIDGESCLPGQVETVRDGRSDERGAIAELESEVGEGRIGGPGIEAKTPCKAEPIKNWQKCVAEGEAEMWQKDQDYFVPWHLPYHRAEVGGASTQALLSGLARKDDLKAAVVYDRFYHVFKQGELER